MNKSKAKEAIMEGRSLKSLREMPEDHPFFKRGEIIIDLKLVQGMPKKEADPKNPN